MLPVTWTEDLAANAACYLTAVSYSLSTKGEASSIQTKIRVSLYYVLKVLDMKYTPSGKRPRIFVLFCLFCIFVFSLLTDTFSFSDPHTDMAEDVHGF